MGAVDMFTGCEVGDREKMLAELWGGIGKLHLDGECMVALKEWLGR